MITIYNSADGELSWVVPPGEKLLVADWSWGGTLPVLTLVGEKEERLDPISFAMAKDGNGYSIIAKTNQGRFPIEWEPVAHKATRSVERLNKALLNERS